MVVGVSANARISRSFEVMVSLNHEKSFTYIFELVIILTNYIMITYCNKQNLHLCFTV